MPKSDSRRTLLRHWEIIHKLPRVGAGITARQLQAHLNDVGFEVDLRQVQRDLPMLQEVLPIECNDKSRPYGWRWIKGATPTLYGISTSEALSLVMAKESIQTLMPLSLSNLMQDALAQAERILLTSGSTMSVWPSRVRSVPATLPLHPPEISAEVLLQVQQALLEQRQLEVEYLSADNAEGKPLTLHPLGLVQQGGLLYLIATAFGYQDIRIYGIHRIQHATKLTETAIIPATFDIDNYIQDGGFQYGAGERLDLKLAITGPLPRLLSETPLADDQKMVQQDGSILLQATVRDSWQLHWWILSQGAAIEVLEPQSLRQAIAGKLRQAAALYAQP